MLPSDFVAEATRQHIVTERRADGGPVYVVDALIGTNFEVVEADAEDFAGELFKAMRTLLAKRARMLEQAETGSVGTRQVVVTHRHEPRARGRRRQPRRNVVRRTRAAARAPDREPEPALAGRAA